jgi:hypothetical protein
VLTICSLNVYAALFVTVNIALDKGMPGKGDKLKELLKNVILKILSLTINCIVIDRTNKNNILVCCDNCKRPV